MKRRYPATVLAQRCEECGEEWFPLSVSFEGKNYSLHGTLTGRERRFCSSKCKKRNWAREARKRG